MCAPATPGVCFSGVWVGPAKARTTKAPADGAGAEAAYHSYLGACPRASIIVAGEALLRTIYDCIIQLCASGANVTVSRNRRAAISLGDATPADARWRLTDELTFYEAIQALQKFGVYPNDLINHMLVVQCLRNCAAHGDLPLLDDWDPDDPRPLGELMEILQDRTYDFPEGYSFISSKDGSKQFKFDLRKYKCGSLKPLQPDDRFAVIQQAVVLDVIARITKVRGTVVKQPESDETPIG